jgi:hypothetical protein
MEPLQPVSAPAANEYPMIRRSRPAFALVLALFMLAGLPGCVPEFFTTGGADPAVVPCQITTRWEREIHFPANIKDGGKPIAQIVGTMLVYLYNDMPEAQDIKEPLDIWVISTADVKRLERRDAAGWGYTLLLPWTSYKPDLTRVRIQVRFDRIGGKDPLYSDMNSISFENATKPAPEIAHVHTGPVLPKNGQLLNLMPQNGAGTPTAAGASLPTGLSFGLPAGSTPDSSEKPETSVTKSPAPIGDNVPFIVPGAGNR